MTDTAAEAQVRTAGGAPERQGGGRKAGHPPISRWEWVVAALSAVAVLGTMGILVHDAVTGAPGPPAVVVTRESVSEVPGGWLVEVAAHNRGGATAAALLVEGELTKDGRAVETSEATIDFVPPDGVRHAGLFFAHDPATHRLELRPKGYDEP